MILRCFHCQKKFDENRSISFIDLRGSNGLWFLCDQKLRRSVTDIYLFSLTGPKPPAPHAQRIYFILLEDKTKQTFVYERLPFMEPLFSNRRYHILRMTNYKGHACFSYTKKNLKLSINIERRKYLFYGLFITKSART